MSEFLKKPGSVLTVIAAVIALAACVVVGITAFPARVPVMVTKTSLRSEPTTNSLRLALSICGLSPEALAAAGISAEQIPALVARTSDYLAHDGQGLNERAAAVRTLRTAVGKLESKVRSGLASKEEIAGLDSKRAELASAEQAVQSLVTGFTRAGTTGVNGEAVQMLQNFAANRPHELPIEYLAVQRENKNWNELRDALANVRVAAKTGVEPDPRCQKLVEAANAEPSVASAKQGLANLKAVEAAWNAAVKGK